MVLKRRGYFGRKYTDKRSAQAPSVEKIFRALP